MALNPPKVSVSSGWETSSITAEELGAGAGRANPQDSTENEKAKAY